MKLGDFIATAYCVTGQTSTGTQTTVGRTLAVNPHVIPYGTEVWLYLEDGTFAGDFIAEDTGSNMLANSNVIDIYMGEGSYHDCILWGAQNVEVYIRATANPGGVGHGWVKERFITAAQPMQTIWEQFKVRFPDGHEETRWKSRIFVPSSVFDNKILLANNPDYLTSLASMPEQERKALLYGDWDTFAGQVFTEWRNDSDHYTDRINTHVISPFKVPQDWAIWCGLDWGYSRPFSVGWYAVDRDRRLYRIREYYGCTGTPNTGVKMEPSEVAREIRRIEAEDPNLKDRRINRVGDPAIWGSDGTESIGALMERQRVYFERGDHARIDGKMQVHHRLAFDEEGIPMLYVFNTCKHFIRTVPNLVYDEKNVEDINTEGEDHIYDELRYVCMKNPIAPRRNKPPALVVYDPLDLGQDQQYDRYDFYRRY